MSTAISRLRLPADFFYQLSRASVRALLLDYDGTLAPFTADRDHAAPYPGVTERLRCIVQECDTRVIIVSGRPARDIPRLLGLDLPLEIWGCHGCERLFADGAYQCETLDTARQDGVAEALEWLESEGLSRRIELKPSGVAVHWRGLPAGEARETRVAAYRALWPLRRLRVPLTEFDGGLELRATERDKGYVVRTLLRELGRDACLACLGDDATDEDAFRALKGHGLSLLVRPDFRPTMADLWIKPPDELVRFLRHWAEMCGGVP
ncbi:MAG TPA: trehalose-phosphatase [Terriglobales bacterium]|nr:trehalose-phosphatase [Terriglobales bacterium]